MTFIDNNLKNAVENSGSQPFCLQEALLVQDNS